MVVKHVFPNGSRLHGPPYTKAEEDEFYKRIGGGPTTIARGTGDRTKPTSPKQQQAVAGKTAPLLRACSSRSIQPCPWPIILRAFWMSSCG
jgi:hypothetical protein